MPPEVRLRLTCALSCSHTPPHIEYRRNGHPYTIYKYLYKYMPLQVYTVLQTTCKHCKRTTQQQEQAGRTTFSAALALAFAFAFAFALSFSARARLSVTNPAAEPQYPR